MAAYADALRGFVAALGLERPVLVGHSMGGAVVLEAAAADPERWSALVLVDGSAPEGLITPEAHYPLLEMFKGNAPLLKSALAPLLASRQPPDFDDLVADGLRMHPDAFAGNARALHDLDLAPRLAAYRGRVLVIRGGLDPLITAEMAGQHRRRLRGRRPRRARDLGRRRPQPRDRGTRALRGAARRSALRAAPGGGGAMS
jgi:pimeloyl-ACP methyl ester carboxylesterase